MNEQLLTTHIQACVTLGIRDLQRQGGPSDWHVEEAQRRFATLRASDASEALLFASAGKTRDAVSILVECLSVLAFVDGGITAFGCHFEACIEQDTVEVT